MEISRKTDYALLLLSVLVEEEGRFVSVRSAAERVGVPYSFARSIQHGLVEGGIVESQRGANGGMRLVADPAALTIRRIVEAVQGPMFLNECTGDDGCPRAEACCYHPIWIGAQALMDSYLDSVTLDDVVRRRRYPAVDPMFCDRERFVEYAACGRVEDGAEEGSAAEGAPDVGGVPALESGPAAENLPVDGDAGRAEDAGAEF